MCCKKMLSLQYLLPITLILCGACPYWKMRNLVDIQMAPFIMVRNPLLSIAPGELQTQCYQNRMGFGYNIMPWKFKPLSQEDGFASTQHAL